MLFTFTSLQIFIIYRIIVICIFLTDMHFIYTDTLTLCRTVCRSTQSLSYAEYRKERCEMSTQSNSFLPSIAAYKLSLGTDLSTYVDLTSKVKIVFLLSCNVTLRNLITFFYQNNINLSRCIMNSMIVFITS